MSDIPTLDPKEYGDLERFMSMARQVNSALKAITKQAWADSPDSNGLAQAIAFAESNGLLDQAKACQTFLKAYEGWFDEAEDLPKRIIFEHITNLLDSYPSHRINNPRVYVQTLVEEIYRKETHRIVVELTCRELKRTCKTPPALATVLEVLDKRREQFNELDWDLEATIEWAREDVEELRRKEAELAACPYLRVGHRVKSPDGRLGTVVSVQDHAGVNVRFDGQPGSSPFYDPPCMLTFADGRQIQPAPKEAPPPSAEGMTIGQQVRHAKFGLGTVLDIDGNKLAVEFKIAGRKMVLANFVTREDGSSATAEEEATA